MRAAVWLVCGACAFDPRAGASAPDAAPEAGPIVDADVDAAPVALCTQPPRLDDRFTGTTACTPWGASYVSGNTSVSQGNGALTITPIGSQTSGGCAEPQVHGWGDNGVIVEVPEVLTGSTNYTVFQLLGLDRSMGVVNNALVFTNGDGTQPFRIATYVPGEMRWWRMRPIAGGIVAEYSADAATWTAFQTATTPLGAMRLNLIAGTDGGVAVGKAELARVVICP